jgi:hypothetical protein
MMSELAFTQNGDTFEVPAAVTGWRVRRLKPRGAPELVYGRDGRPLVVPVECEMDDLRAAVGSLGKYRLDPVDDHGKVIEGVPAAYVQVVKAEKSVDEPGAIATQHDRDGVLKEAMRMNTELAKAVVDRFPEMMHAAAELLRAADGAGLPARLPRHVDINDDEVDDDDAADGDAAGFDLNALVAQFVPMVMAGFANGKLKMPNLAALLDWRRATPDAAGASAKRPKGAIATSTETVVDSGDTAETSARTALPEIDPATMAHFIAIQSALTPEEATLAREVAGQLEPAELRAWFDELSKLDVAEAVKKVRKLVSGAGKTGAAS